MRHAFQSVIISSKIVFSLVKECFNVFQNDLLVLKLSFSTVLTVYISLTFIKNFIKSPAEGYAA